MEVAVTIVVEAVKVVEAIVGLVPKTSAPLPVSSLTAVVRFALVTSFEDIVTKSRPATKVSNSDSVSIEVEDILFWKVAQSVVPKQPNTAPVAVAHVRTFEAFVSPFPVRSVKYSELMPKRGV